MPGPERGGGCVRIVSRHQVCASEGVAVVLVAGVRVWGFERPVGYKGGSSLWESSCEIPFR